MKIGKRQNSYKFPVIPAWISEIPGNSRREFWVSRFPRIPGNSRTGIPGGLDFDLFGPLENLGFRPVELLRVTLTHFFWIFVANSFCFSFY